MTRHVLLGKILYTVNYSAVEYSGSETTVVIDILESIVRQTTFREKNLTRRDFVFVN